MASFLVNNKWNVRNTGWFYGIMEQPKDVLSIINYQTHVFLSSFYLPISLIQQNKDKLNICRAVDLSVMFIFHT